MQCVDCSSKHWAVGHRRRSAIMTAQICNDNDAIRHQPGAPCLAVFETRVLTVARCFSSHAAGAETRRLSLALGESGGQGLKFSVWRGRPAREMSTEATSRQVMPATTGACPERGRRPPTYFRVQCHRLLGAVSVRTWTSAPFPPSPPHRDQHTVVHGYNAPCVCAPYWAYAVRAGVEPSSAALALPDRHCPAGGLCSLLFAATTNYLLVLVQQRRQPIRFLYPRVELAVLT